MSRKLQDVKYSMERVTEAVDDFVEKYREMRNYHWKDEDRDEKLEKMVEELEKISDLEYIEIFGR